MAAHDMSRDLKREQRPFSNLLQALKENDYALIAPYIAEEERQTGELLYNPGDNVAQVYFPLGPSLVSYLVPGTDGRSVETVLVGREGAVGGIVSSGFLPAYCLITVKFGGPFARASIASIQAAKDQSASFRRLFSRYADCLMAQMFQATACNAVHSIEQRMAKWILAAMDRTGDHMVPLTHDQLASLIGVGRSYASRVLQKFREDGILTTSRGAFIVEDQQGLAARACQCNESVRAHFDVVLKGVYPEGCIEA
jgi:DNA-binding transcriptional regulator YhcF (GntR family)